MDCKQLQKKIIDITIWKKGEQQAPHKPLLLLCMSYQIIYKDIKRVRLKGDHLHDRFVQWHFREEFWE